MNKKAIIWGLVTFAGLYVFHAAVIPFLVNVTDRNLISGSLIWSFHQLLGLLTCVIAGFVSGRIAGDAGFKHGFIVGMLGTLLSAALASIMPVSPVSSYPMGVKVVSWLLVNGALTGLAGIFGVTVATKKRGTEKVQNENNRDFRA